MSGLGEQIAVLDGLAALDPNDGRIGQVRARVDQYGRPVMPGVLARSNVIDASAGANYSGGSSYAPRLPLLPSSVGLANIPSVLPGKMNVVDPSGGANYTGGADYVPGMPLLVSSAGLAGQLIKGGYGKAGFGGPFIQGGYGKAGLGQTNTPTDMDLAGAAEAVETARRRINPNDGRIGQQRARVDEYGRPVMPGVLERSDVIDASAGANYSGGSSYAPRLPLLPSSIGLAGLGALNALNFYDPLDGVSDQRLPPRFRGKVGVARLKSLLRRAQAARRRAGNTKSVAVRRRALAQLAGLGQQLVAVRAARRQLFGNPQPPFGVRRPLWAR